MCLDCDGLGTRYSFDPDLLIPDPAKSFYDGAIPIVGPLRGMGRWRKHIYEGVAATFGIDLKTPWRDLPDEHQAILLQPGHWRSAHQPSNGTCAAAISGSTAAPGKALCRSF